MSKSSEELSATPLQRGRRLKNMALFFASPFIGLYYAVLMPGKLIQLARAELQAAAAKPVQES